MEYATIEEALKHYLESDFYLDSLESEKKLEDREKWLSGEMRSYFEKRKKEQNERLDAVHDAEIDALLSYRPFVVMKNVTKKPPGCRKIGFTCSEELLSPILKFGEITPDNLGWDCSDWWLEVDRRYNFQAVLRFLEAMEKVDEYPC
jgi:hypothetical protein